MHLDINSTKSLENVKKAFACESQARNEYTYFAKQARLEGDNKTADLFEEMAENEREHAKVWYKVLNNGIGSTIENLENSASKEQAEWEHMYPDFAKKAREEGLELLAIMFENVAAIEKNHSMMFQERIEQLKKNKSNNGSFEGKAVLICKNCGFVAKEKMEVCPVCEERETFVKR